jgi:siroheme synthase-like protein
VNAAVSSAARERRIPVYVVDEPALSSFIFRAIIDRSPFVVAASFAGGSPVLARRVRAQIEALLPARLRGSVHLHRNVDEPGLVSTGRLKLEENVRKDSMSLSSVP